MKTFLDVLFECELLEATPIRKKINRRLKRKSHIAYLKNKARLKMRAKKFRKSSSYKKYQRKAKLMKKKGLTSTGKRKVIYVK